MGADHQTGSTPPPNESDSPPINGEERDGSWSREYLVAQVVIVLGIAAAVAGALISQDRGLASLSEQPEIVAPSSAGFSIVQQGSAPPIVCPGGAPSEHPTAEDGLAEDCAALLTALPTLVGEGELDWSLEVPVTLWSGVIAGGDPVRVVALNLTTNGLTGEIPPEMGNLSALSALHLFGNELTGEIPPELGRLASLTILDLGENRLTGEIPPEIGNMTNLTWVDFSFNDLSGAVPDEIYTLERLEWLVIAGNDLSGSITGKLDGLTSLTYLSLYDTDLEGCLPDTLRDIDGLLGDVSFCADQ